MNVTLKKIIKATVYFVCMLAIIEGAVRIFIFKYRGINPQRINCSLVWRIRWIKELAPKKRVHPDDCYVYDEQKGWDVKPGYKNEKCKGKFRVTINSKGLRSFKEIPYENKDNRQRILLLGDSFTFGDDCSDEEIFSYFLDKMLPDVDVLNLGVSGYGHDQIFLKFKAEGLKYNPDIVILNFIRGDMHRNTLFFRDYAKPKFVVKDDRLVLKGVPVPTSKEIIMKEFLRPCLLTILGLAKSRKKEEDGAIEEEKLRVTKRLIVKMNDLCKNIGAKFVIVYVISHPILEDLSNEGIPVWFVGGSSISIRDTDRHWNSAEHKIVAGEIRKHLLSNKMI